MKISDALKIAINQGKYITSDCLKSNKMIPSEKCEMFEVHNSNNEFVEWWKPYANELMADWRVVD